MEGLRFVVALGIFLFGAYFTGKLRGVPLREAFARGAAQAPGALSPAAALSSAANARASAPLSGEEDTAFVPRPPRSPRAGPKRAGTGPELHARSGGPARTHGRTGSFFFARG